MTSPVGADSDRPVSLALLEPDPALRERTVRLLSTRGKFVIHPCSGAGQLFNCLDAQEAEVVLFGTSNAMNETVGRLLPRLRESYSVTVVVQAERGSARDRVALLEAGAHLCLDRPYDGAELGALLRAQVRRQTMKPWRRPPTQRVPASSAEAPWEVLFQGWVLRTPAGARVPLTGVERACFLCLLQSPQRELARAALSEHLDESSLRSVNVVISRLRKKVRGTGMRLPLHTVHGVGYVFIGNLVGEAGLGSPAASAEAPAERPPKG